MNKIMLIVLLGLTGCATIVNTTRQSVGISSNPSGATAKTQSGLYCITPCTLELARRNSHTITFEKEGYETSSASVAQSPSGWLWGDLVFGGIIGLVVDLSSGGAYKLKPETVTTDLIKK